MPARRQVSARQDSWWRWWKNLQTEPTRSTRSKSGCFFRIFCRCSNWTLKITERTDLIRHRNLPESFMIVQHGGNAGVHISSTEWLWMVVCVRRAMRDQGILYITRKCWQHQILMTQTLHCLTVIWNTIAWSVTTKKKNTERMGRKNFQMICANMYLRQMGMWLRYPPPEIIFRIARAQPPA